MLVYGSVDSFCRILLHFPQFCSFSVIDHSRHDSRLSGLAFFDPEDLGLVEFPTFNIHQFPGITVTDSMPKSTKISVHIHISHGSDSLSIIPDPGTKLIASVFRKNRCHIDLDPATITPDSERQRLSV